MSRRTDRVNRLVLTLLGIVLLALGVAGLLLGTGVLGLGLEDDYLLGRGEVATSYAVPGVVVAAALVLVLALRWLALQARTDTVGAVDLSTDRSDGETLVEAGAVTAALEDAAAAVGGVDSARARLLRRRGEDLLVLRVRVRERTDLEQVRSRLAAGPVSQVRTALGSACPALRVEIEPVPRGAPRSRELG